MKLIPSLTELDNLMHLKDLDAWIKHYWICNIPITIIVCHSHLKLHILENKSIAVENEMEWSTFHSRTASSFTRSPFQLFLFLLLSAKGNALQILT